MANKQIGELNAATLPLAGTEEAHVVQSGNSRKVAVSEFLARLFKLDLSGEFDGADRARARANIGIAWPTRTEADDYSVEASDGYKNLIMSIAETTITLPPLSSVLEGVPYSLRNTSTGIVTITADGSDTVEDQVTGAPIGLFVLTSGRGGVLAKMGGVWRWVGPQPDRTWESTPQTITAGGALTLSHGLGVMPTVIIPSLVCVTADLGYSPGDEVLVNPSINAAGAASYGQGIMWTATDILVRYGASTVGGGSGAYQILRKDTGAFGVIVLANWRLIVRAFA